MEQIILSQYSLTDIANELATVILNKLTQNGYGDVDSLMTSEEVISTCNISAMTLFNWRSKGKLPFKKVGKKIYYSKNDVMALTMPVKKRL